MINVTYGNPIPLRIQLERGGVTFNLSKCTNITVTIIGPGVSKKANDTRIDGANGFIYVTIPASSKVGMYGIEIAGKIDDVPWRAKYNKVVEITDSTVLGGNDAIYNGTGDYYDVVISVRLQPTNSFDWVQSDWSVIDETDPAYIKNKPTIPYIYAWAKQPTKPHYTAEEVGALPVSTIIPTKTSDLINDSGFVTEAAGGGDENVIETIKVNSVTLPVSDKIVDITIPTDLKDLVDDSTHRLVTDADKTAWNNKSNFSGSYNDLTDKPNIPNVPSWALQPTKPTYTANEVGALPSTTYIPDVPSWAMQSTKPTYTAQEIGALPSSTIIPTKTSDLTNDSGFLTAHQSLANYETKMGIVSNPTLVNNTLAIAADDLWKYYKLGVSAPTTITLPYMLNEAATTIVGVIINITLSTGGSLTLSATQPIYENGLSDIEEGATFEINAIYNGSYWAITVTKLELLS